MSTSTLPSAAVAVEDLLTLREAAELGYGAYSTLRKRIREGKLTAYHLGNRIVLHRDDLDALITPVHPAGPSLDPAVAAWVESVAATAPPLSPADAAAVAALLVRGGAAA
ncbi:helix-turn-helix domain-containing protein [Gordonia alkaliphila]|uniref:Helix-turn-helix domain-containing protein n=1 Tax=Gordonia alkaliphila TaxID=1053547 RepID=A0ABP8ZII2_9ACTN